MKKQIPHTTGDERYRWQHWNNFIEGLKICWKIGMVYLFVNTSVSFLATETSLSGSGHQSQGP